MVYFKFHDTDLDRRIKAETHTIYKYEHDAITEDEMREELGKDPITDVSKMHYVLHGEFETTNQVTIAEAGAAARSAATAASGASKKATNNKQKPANQSGTKTSPKKSTNTRTANMLIGIVSDVLDMELDYYEDRTRETVSLKAVRIQVQYAIDSFIEVPLDKQKLKDSISRVVDEASDQIEQVDSEIIITYEMMESVFRNMRTRMVDIISENL
jgi:hypothetical protein